MIHTPIQEIDIKVGLKFIPIGKSKTVHIVTDIIDHVSRTTGKCFYTEYATEHLFAGQTVRSTVNIVTIQRGVWENGPIN